MPCLLVDPGRLSDAVEEWFQNITGMKISINKRVQKSLGQKIGRLRSLFQEWNLAELWKLGENERLSLLQYDWHAKKNYVIQA